MLCYNRRISVKATN